MEAPIVEPPNGARDERHPARSRRASGAPGRAGGERSEDVRFIHGPVKRPGGCLRRPLQRVLGYLTF